MNWTADEYEHSLLNDKIAELKEENATLRAEVERLLEIVNSNGETESLWSRLTEAREEQARLKDMVKRQNKLVSEMVVALKATRTLCDWICNSHPDTTIKGKIESMAFVLGHYDVVLNIHNKAALGESE